MKPTPRELLDSAARTRVPDDLNLYPRLAQHLERKTWMQTFRAKPALAILFVFMALILLTGVTYAVGRLAGFIPGFGFTGDASTSYVLDTRAQTEHAGVTIQVENAVSTADQFWVSLAVIGEADAMDAFHAGATVVLSDGTEIQAQSGQDYGYIPGQHQVSLEFTALPTGTDSLTLRYEVFTITGAALWSVDIPIILRPIRADEVIPAQETQAAPLQSNTYDGLTLVLDNVAPASEKTVLQVSLRFDKPNTHLNTDWNVTLTGDDGRIYPMTEVLFDSNDYVKTYETVPFHGGEALNLSLTAFPSSENLPMSVDFPLDQATFTFDPGPNPQPGQSWSLDEQITVGQYTIQVIGVKQISNTELLFEFAPSPGVTGVMLYSPLAQGATGSIPVENVNFTAGLSFGSVPAEPLTISISRVYYTARGQWQIHWQAPAAPVGVSVGPTSTPVPTAATFATPSVIASDPLLLEVQDLAQKFDEPFQQGAGWVHIISETETLPRPGQTFPPPYVQHEQWLELDEDGYVIRSLWIDRDLPGNIIQRSVTIGNYSFNLTTGEAFFNEYARYLFSTDLLTQDLIRAAEYQSQIIQEATTCDNGSACLLITLFDAFDQGIQNPGESQLITGMGRRTWVNLETGQQVQVQAFSRLQDGSERVEITDRAVMIEKTSSPPTDVLDIFNSVVVP